MDLALMLKRMGAKIDGIGTEVIRIKGVEGLNPCDYEVIPDRIEAGTFLVGCGLTRGSIVLEGVRAEHMKAVIEKLKETGMEIVEEEGRIKSGHDEEAGPAAFDIKTLPHPGFPTDMQAQAMALMGISRGVSVITRPSSKTG